MKEWWAKIKYKLLKLINEKYSLISKLMKPPLPAERTKSEYFESIFNPKHKGGNQKSIGTEPDVLSVLEGLRKYYQNQDYEASTVQEETSLPPVSPKKNLVLNDSKKLEAIPESDYKTSKNSKLQRMGYILKSERARSKRDLQDHAKIGKGKFHTSSIEVIKPRKNKDLIIKSSEKPPRKHKEKETVLENLSDSGKDNSARSDSLSQLASRAENYIKLTNPYESFLDDRIETRTSQSNNQVVPSVSPVSRNDRGLVGPSIHLVNSYKSIDVPRIMNIKCSPTSIREKIKQKSSGKGTGLKINKPSKYPVFRSSESPLREHNIFTQQSKEKILKRLAMEKAEMEEKTIFFIHYWDKPFSENYMVRAKKQQRRKEYWNLRVMPPGVTPQKYN